MRVQSFSDVGLKRTNNEDYKIYDEKLGIFVICDGMGGHHGGEIASKEVGDSFFQNIYVDKSEMDQTVMNDVLTDYAFYAQEALDNKVGNYSDAGTTMTSGVLVDDVLWIGHVGDSRAYHITNITQLTVDETLAEEMVAQGKLALAEVKNSYYSHILNNVFQANTPVPKVTVLNVPVKEGDRFLFCTDGLSNEIENEELYEICNGDWESITDKLSELCLERGARDNFSFILLEI